MLWKSYQMAKTTQEVLEILRTYEGRARVIAGGTDITPKLKDGEMTVECLIDITNIEDLKKIELEGNLVRIGAAVTHHQIVSSALLKEKCPLLIEAAAEVGTPQVRNQGTVLGNIINAQPAADTAVALMTLDAEVRVVSQNGSKWWPLEDLYEGVGVSKVKSNQEIAVEVRFPMIQVNQGFAYIRMRGRNDFWLPTLNTAVLITIEDKKMASGSISIAPVAPRPLRAKKAEEILRGAPLTEKMIDRIAKKAFEEACPRNSLLRGSSEYRKEMVAILVRDALFRAVKNVKK